MRCEEELERPAAAGGRRGNAALTRHARNMVDDPTLIYQTDKFDELYECFRRSTRPRDLLALAPSPASHEEPSLPTQDAAAALHIEPTANSDSVAHKTLDRTQPLAVSPRADAPPPLPKRDLTADNFQLNRHAYRLQIMSDLHSTNLYEQKAYQARVLGAKALLARRKRAMQVASEDTPQEDTDGVEAAEQLTREIRQLLGGAVGEKRAEKGKAGARAAGRPKGQGNKSGKCTLKDAIMTIGRPMSRLRSARDAAAQGSVKVVVGSPQDGFYYRTGRHSHWLSTQLLQLHQARGGGAASDSGSVRAELTTRSSQRSRYRHTSLATDAAIESIELSPSPGRRPPAPVPALLEPFAPPGAGSDAACTPPTSASAPHERETYEIWHPRPVRFQPQKILRHFHRLTLDEHAQAVSLQAPPGDGNKYRTYEGPQKKNYLPMTRPQRFRIDTANVRTFWIDKIERGHIIVRV